jgi:hypothetical protein
VLADHVSCGFLLYSGVHIRGVQHIACLGGISERPWGKSMEQSLPPNHQQAAAAGGSGTPLDSFKISKKCFLSYLGTRNQHKRAL